MTAVQLKALCKDQGLKVAGKKADLQQRLREHLLSSPEPEVEEDEFDEMSDDDLRISLGTRELETSGNREELLERLRVDIRFSQELNMAESPNDSKGYATVTEALQAAAQTGEATMQILSEMQAKSKEPPKYMDVTIRSLGMVPEKHTVGGAPSVTSDVLRKLAGDPYENPPKYGSVSALRQFGASWIEFGRALLTLFSFPNNTTGLRVLQWWGNRT
jgi:hypothetical protein